MGTGVLALTSFGAGRSFPFLANLGWALHWFNLVLFAVRLVPWTLRWFMFPAEARQTLRHPLHANFVPAVAIAMLERAILLDVVGLGAGFFLYLGFLAITLHRFVLHKPLPGAWYQRCGATSPQSGWLRGV